MDLFSISGDISARQSKKYVQVQEDEIYNYISNVNLVKEKNQIGKRVPDATAALLSTVPDLLESLICFPWLKYGPSSLSLI
jgi:hypothetical protein